MDDDIKEVVKELGAVKADLTKQQVELKDAHKQVMDSITKGLPLAKDAQDSIDKALVKANETGGAVQELAQKLDGMQKAIVAGPTQPMTTRQAIAKALDEIGKDKYESFLKRDGVSSLRVVMKDINSVAIAGIRPNPTVDSLVSMERIALRVRDLLTVIPVTTDSVRYGRQSLRTNNAAIVPEGITKPYSNYAWVNMTANVEVIAHLTKLTLQAIADAPRLVAEIEAEMRFGLALAEEFQLLKGTGVPGQLSGLIQNSTAYAVPVGVVAANVLTSVDKLRIAILQIHLALAVPDAHVLNPVDVANIELLRRDPDKGGGYIFGNPDSADPILRLWRLPVVESFSMDVDKFLTGGFRYAATLYQREGVTALISTENDNDFEKNLATLRVEERIGLAVKRPYALVYGDFGNVV